MRTLIILEHSHHEAHAAFPQLLAAAIQFQQPVTVFIMGSQCQALAHAVAICDGVSHVLLADNACYIHQLPENISQLIALVGETYSHILMHSSPWGRSVLPRVAALLDSPQVSEVTHILSMDTVQHPIYAGNAIETIRILAPKKLMTIRSLAFAAITTQQAPCPIEIVTHEFYALKTNFIEQSRVQTTRPELTQAPCVVSGGRGLQSAQQFKLIEALADALGAAVGATRAAVDAGFIANEHQVGQTGKIVAPLLYIAVGISGAIQHTAGMSNAKVIVAINKDADAPIMQLANYALVGDLFELLPELIERIKQLECCYVSRGA
jgi:electron transfer flavoprotein alpha subunit